GDAGQEEDPAFKEVQEAFGLADAVAVDQHANHADTEGVHQHRDRHRRQQQHQLVPARAVIEHRKDVGEAHDREEIAQARAGLGHQQLVDPEVDYVAIEINRHIGQPHDRDPDFRRDQLQRGVDFPVDEVRQRQHEDEVQHRGPEDDAAPPAETGQDQPADPDDQGIEDQIVDLHEVADNREHQAGAEHDHAGPAVGDGGGVRRHRLHLAQEHVERQDRDDG